MAEIEQTPEDSPRTQQLKTIGWCLCYGAGIIGTLVVYGILQERIMTIPYDNVMFTFAPFLVLCNRLSNVIYAAAMTKYKEESFAWKAPLYKYFVVSISNVAATTCQYEALRFVSFPVQMLGKSFKMMPVMVWGIIISGKRYGPLDWLIAACVTGGVTEFLLTGPISDHSSNGNSVRGLILLLVFLACDGLTSTMQEKLFKEYATSKYNQMFYVNMCSSVVSLISCLVSGSLFPSIMFIGAHSAFLGHTVLLSCSATASQFFIYSQVKEFGALVFAATMNVRQVVSILISYAEFQHHITGLQIIGLVLVFGALFFKSYKGLMEAPSTSETAKISIKKDDEAQGKAEGVPESRASV